MKAASIILCIMLLLALCSLISAQEYSIACTQPQQLRQPIITVPTNAMSSIKSYSIQGWVRLSMTYPKTWAFDQISQIGGSLFGVSTSKLGRLPSDFTSDSVLSASMRPLSYREGFFVFYDSKKTMETLDSPKPLADLLGRWFFVYAAYHADLNQVYFAIKDTFYQTYSEKWSEKTIVRNPMKKVDFYFTLGVSSSSNQDQPISGQVKDPTLKYLPSDIYFKTPQQIESSIEEYRISKIQPYQEQLRIQSYLTNSKMAMTILIGQGSDDYSITVNIQQKLQFVEEILLSLNYYFWLFIVRFSSLKATQKDVLLFRVATNKSTNTQTAYLEGDRVFSAYFEKGTKLCFATYSLGLKGFNLNVTKCFPDVDLSSRSISIYQGYSRKPQQVYIYFRTGGKEYSHTFDQVLHMDPYYYYLYTGFDSMTLPLDELKINNSTMDFGIGAFRAPSSTIVTPKINDKPELFNSDPSSTTSFKTVTVDSDNFQNSQQFAIHFWYRRDFTNSSSDQITLARKTTTNIVEIKQENKVLSIGYYHPQSSLSVLVQDQKGVYSDAYLDFPMKENEGEWIQSYFGYNLITKEAIQTIILQNGKSVTRKFSLLSPIGSGSLKAEFGKAADQMSAPGEVFNIQFVSQNGCFADTPEALNSFLKQYSDEPPSRKPIAGRYEYLKNALFSDTQKPSGVPLQVSKDGTQIKDYSIEGWAIWDHATQKTDKGSVLLSSSLLQQDDSYNITKIKDVVLQISMSTAGVVFTTYNFGKLATDDIPQISQTIPLPDYSFDDQWCFYQFTYSYNASQAYGSVKCDNGFTGSVSFPNITHIISSRVYFIVGQTPISNQWYGSLFKPTFVVYEQSPELERVTNADRPLKAAECPTLFSQCGYVSEIAKICENKESFNLKEVKSVYVPKGQVIVFYKKANYKGIYVSFIDSVQCLNAGLTDDPSVQWSQMTALFHQGKVTFSNEKGIALSLHQAKIEFLGKGNQRKISHTQQKILQEDTEEAALA